MGILHSEPTIKQIYDYVGAIFPRRTKSFSIFQKAVFIFFIYHANL